MLGCMKLPADSVIPIEKLTHYLLVPLARADKSRFLEMAGYNADNPGCLLEDLRSQILPQDAEPAGSTGFGNFFHKAIFRSISLSKAASRR